MLHEPDMLLLDEPTSGVDPVARDEFWELLIDLSRRQGVTIFVSTHFMNEALRCDRISLMHAGTVLACDTPAQLMASRGTDDLEAAFIGYIADAEPPAKAAGIAPEQGRSRHRRRGPRAARRLPTAPAHDHDAGPGSAWDAMLAYSRREAQEIERDPVRLLFAFRRLGPHDARLRLWHHHRRREHPLRRPGPRPIAREPRLPLGFRGLAVLHSPPAGPDPG